MIATRDLRQDSSGGGKVMQEIKTRKEEDMKRIKKFFSVSYFFFTE